MDDNGLKREVLDGPTFDLRQLNEFRSNRVSDERSFQIPDHWRDEKVKLDLSRRYTLSSRVEISGRATFGAKPMVVSAEPCLDSEVSMFAHLNGSMSATSENVSVAQNNIAVGDVQIVEHPLALTTGLGMVLKFGITQPSFPSFDNCLGIFLSNFLSRLTELGPARCVTVRKPFGMRFSNGAYAIVEPDEGEGALVIDHQIDHAKNCLGTMRTVYRVEPQSFAYISNARTMSYGLKTTAMQLLARLGKSRRLPCFGLSWGNVVVVGKQGILNPRQEFDAGGRNWEPMMHEIIDKAGAIALIEGRFIGKLTLFRTSHAQDVEFISHIQEQLQ